MMLLTAWKPIQLLFLFAVFAILGWLMEQVLYFVTGRAALRSAAARGEASRSPP